MKKTVSPILLSHSPNKKKVRLGGYFLLEHLFLSSFWLEDSALKMRASREPMPPANFVCFVIPPASCVRRPLFTATLDFTFLQKINTKINVDKF